MLPSYSFAFSWKERNQNNSSRSDKAPILFELFHLLFQDKEDLGFKAQLSCFLEKQKQNNILYLFVAAFYLPNQ